MFTLWQTFGDPAESGLLLSIQPLTNPASNPTLCPWHYLVASAEAGKWSLEKWSLLKRGEANWQREACGKHVLLLPCWTCLGTAISWAVSSQNNRVLHKFNENCIEKFKKSTRVLQSFHLNPTDFSELLKGKRGFWDNTYCYTTNPFPLIEYLHFYTAIYY